MTLDPYLICMNFNIIQVGYDDKPKCFIHLMDIKVKKKRKLRRILVIVEGYLTRAYVLTAPHKGMRVYIFKNSMRMFGISTRLAKKRLPQAFTFKSVKPFPSLFETGKLLRMKEAGIEIEPDNFEELLK